jgi:hypothetical protein
LACAAMKRRTRPCATVVVCVVTVRRAQLSGTPPPARYSMGLTGLRDTLYVFGGYRENGASVYRVPFASPNHFSLIVLECAMTDPAR